MPFDRKAYLDFIASKGAGVERVGFKPRSLPESMFAHQVRATEFALETGRAALFLDTGLGKSRCEAVFAERAQRKTRKPALILTPLAVAQQMRRECEAVGVDATVIREADQVTKGVNIMNYERLGKLDCSQFGAIVLDESSILKAVMGKTKRSLVAAFSRTPYRLCATATPAPNDHMELGTHSEFLGVMGHMEMLARWFINDTSTASQKWRLKGHAESDFWRWVASWARAASLPSDMGGDDAGFVLPPLNYDLHVVAADITKNAGDALFRVASGSATSMHAEKRLTLPERIARVRDIVTEDGDPWVVWCETNAEQDALRKTFGDRAYSVQGSDSIDKKESDIEAWLRQDRPILLSKPTICGFGLNFQHCSRVVFASISHSYEQHYQAVRRFWRFGQRNPVTVHMVIADTEIPIWQNVRRKAEDHERLKRAMSRPMIDVQREMSGKRAYERSTEIELPAFLNGGKSNAA